MIDKRGKERRFGLMDRNTKVNGFALF
jgi:MORN repeat